MLTDLKFHQLSCVTCRDEWLWFFEFWDKYKKKKSIILWIVWLLGTYLRNPIVAFIKIQEMDCNAQQLSYEWNVVTICILALFFHCIFSSNCDEKNILLINGRPVYVCNYSVLLKQHLFLCFLFLCSGIPKQFLRGYPEVCWDDAGNKKKKKSAEIFKVITGSRWWLGQKFFPPLAC